MGSRSTRGWAVRRSCAATSSWRSPSDQLAGPRGHRDRAQRGASGSRSAHRPVHRSPPMGDRATRLHRRPEGVQREDPRGDPDGLAGRIPEPMTRVVAGRRLPGHDLVGLEDQLEQLTVREVAVETAHRHARRQTGRGAAREDDDRDAIARAQMVIDHGPRERGVRTVDQMEHRGHQNTRNRRPRWTSAAISSRVTGMTAWPSAFQLASVGTASFSTWNGTPSDLRFARNFAISSPSTRSSVSSSSRWTPAPSSTKVTSFSPAPPPRPIRIASFARWDTRGSVEMSTMTGGLAITESVERDEPVGGVDQVGQDDEAAVGHGVGVAQRDTPLLAAVGAHEQLGAALRQGANTRIVQRGDSVVDEVQIEIRATLERGARETDDRLEVRMIAPRGQQNPELLLREVHRGPSVAS